LARIKLYLLQALYHHLAGEVGTTLQEATEAFHDIDNVPDLFQDEYKAVVQQQLVTKPVVGWLQVVGTCSFLITDTLMEDIFAQAPNVDAAEHIVSFWKTEIDRILLAIYTGYSTVTTDGGSSHSTLSPDLSRHWNTFWHLWKTTSLFRQLYTRTFLLQQQPTEKALYYETGKELETNVPWALLCRAAAFSLPLQVINKENPVSLFGKLLIQNVSPQDASQVGCKVFGHDAVQGVQQALDTARQCMQTARTIGTSIWTSTMRKTTGVDKQIVFAWFRQVIQTKYVVCVQRMRCLNIYLLFYSCSRFVPNRCF
jgi:hypothetical protein